MRTQFPEALGLSFVWCGAVKGEDFTRDSIDRMTHAGGRFVEHLSLKEHPNPHSLIKEGDTFTMGDVRHPLLAPDEFTPNEALRFGDEVFKLPLASFSSIPTDGRWVRLSQGTLFKDKSKVDLVAHGLLRLGLELYPWYRPRVGAIDEHAYGYPKGPQFGKGPPPALFWGNFFSPEIVGLLGRDFLEAAPGWRVVDLDDGGVLYVATESYMDWWHTDFTVALDYFRQRVPAITIYRGEPTC